MHFLTNFADEAVIIPLCIVVSIVLLLLGWGRGALAWVIVTFGTLSAIVVTKLGFLMLRGTLPISLNSPSSHVAAGAMVYGVLTALILWGKRASTRAFAVCSLLFAIAFAVTRLIMHAHSRSEVVFGSLLGIGGSVVFAKLAGRMPEAYNRALLAGVCVTAIFLMHGHHLAAEPAIVSIAHNMRAMLKQTF